MVFIESTLFILGLILLIAGYRRNNRNVLLSAAILMLFVGVLDEFARGFHHGFLMGWS